MVFERKSVVLGCFLCLAVQCPDHDKKIRYFNSCLGWSVSKPKVTQSESFTVNFSASN